MTTTPATQAILPVTPEGPFHVSRSSDGTKKWFSARDDASGVTIPAKDRDDAYALVSSLNRACSTYAASQAHSLPVDVGTLRDRVQRARVSAGTHYTTLRNETADAVIAALTPSALSGDAGGGE